MDIFRRSLLLHDLLSYNRLCTCQFTMLTNRVTLSSRQMPVELYISCTPC
jgi:hypothetical protein